MVLWDNDTSFLLVSQRHEVGAQEGTHPLFPHTHKPTSRTLGLLTSPPLRALPVLFAMALARWCHKEAEEEIVALEEFPGIEKLHDLLFYSNWQKCWDGLVKVCFKRAQTGRHIFPCDSVDTNVWLSVGFIHSIRCGGGLSPSSLQSEKQRERDAAAERRATALLLWIIHSHSDRTWMAWLQLLTCAITLTLSITLSPSLTPSSTHMH